MNSRPTRRDTETTVRASRHSRRVARLCAALAHSMPSIRVELNHRNPWELLVATILSAQCTDQRVNQVTPALFARYRHPIDYANALVPELEQLIRPTGFFKSKARHLVGCGRAIAERFGGVVPETMAALTSLPGVGRKTANVVLGNAFGKPAIIVDTHVKRVANRLGLTSSSDPEVIEQDLQKRLPQTEWTRSSQRLLLHGRYVCLARKPKCATCAIYDDCRWEGKLPR